MMITAKKIVNVVLDATAATHLCYSVVRMYNCPIPSEVLPIDTAYGGKLKYLTFWNVCIEAAYFCYAVLENVVSKCNDNEKKPLRKIRDYWFMSIVFPLSAFVCLTFWGLWAIDRELVMPKAIDPYFPTWLNHSVHTFILLYSSLELVTTYHNTLTPWHRHGYALWPVTGTYLAWCVVVWHKSDMWVYPILEHLNWPARIAFFSGSILALTGFLYAGYCLNSFVWRKKIQITSGIRSEGRPRDSPTTTGRGYHLAKD